MAFEAIVRSLKRVPLFHNLQPKQIEELARLSEKVLFKPGEVIIEEGEVGDSAILLVSGSAMRVSGPVAGPHGEEIAEGSMIGEMAMLVESEHSSTVIARSPVRALRINRSDLLEHMAVDRDLADHVVHVLVGRLAELAHELRAVENTLTPPAIHVGPLPGGGNHARSSTQLVSAPH